ncbi:hypothetical protein MMC10_002017 [Thelotrema lepadinum]|nr:hypothetical protein [Thelotrema lepadinum]
MQILPQQNIEALAWTLCLISTTLVLGRYWIRWKLAQKWGWDDILNGVAAVAFICCVAVFQAGLDIQYALLGFSESPPTQSEIDRGMRLDLADNLLFWLTIFFVKASFLATYWKVFSVSRIFRICWWLVAAYTFITFCAIFLSRLWACGQPSEALSFSACSNPMFNQPDLVDLWWWMALMIVGDILIMVLPIGMLAKLNLSLHQRLALAGLFGIVLVDIIFDILRTVFSVQQTFDPSFASLSAVFNLCEPAVAVMVCTLPSYRSLLPTQLAKRKLDLQRQSKDMFNGSWRQQPKSFGADMEPGNLSEQKARSII